MIQKIKSTISTFAISIILVAGSALIGQPLPAAESASPVASQDLNPGEPEQVRTVETQASEQLLRLKSRVGLSMPYYSFGSLLPRARGS